MPSTYPPTVSIQGTREKGETSLHQVQNHVVSQVKSAVEPIRLALDHLLRGCRLELLVDHDDDDSAIIETSPAGAPGHLDVFTGGQPAEGAAVELACSGEHNRLRGHVEADRERLGREEDLEEALLKQDLDHLLQNRE
jgi:hypothetical protein